MTRPRVIAVLDVGSTKVCCIIALCDQNRRVRVVGIGCCRSGGIRAGKIVDMDLASESMSAAVDTAERRAGVRAGQVLVGVSGGVITSLIAQVRTSVDEQVTQEDLQELQALGEQELQALGEQEPEGTNGDLGTTIYSVLLDYRLDDNLEVGNPLRLAAGEVSAQLHMARGEDHVIRNLTNCLRQGQLEVARYVIASHASGLACLTKDERARGAACVELGGGNTGLAIFFRGELAFAGNIPLGGDDLSRDIAQELGLSPSETDHVKLAHSFAADLFHTYPLIDPIEAAGNAGFSRVISSKRLNELVQGHLRELFYGVLDLTKQSKFDQRVGRVVLSGAGSKLPGTRELAQRILQRQVRLGIPVDVDGLLEHTAGRDPGLATAVGLLLFAEQNADSAPVERSWLDKLMGWTSSP